MAPTTKNLKDPLPAQNPRHLLKNTYPTHNAHTEAFLQTQPPSLRSSQALSRPHCSCQKALACHRSPCTEPRSSSSISLSHPRLIVLPHSSNKQTLDYTMPLAASQETRSWLQERGLGGYLRVIDAPTYPDAQAIACNLHPEIVTSNMIRAALDLKARRRTLS